jgi:hypothetical protein
VYFPPEYCVLWEYSFNYLSFVPDYCVANSLPSCGVYIFHVGFGPFPCRNVRCWLPAQLFRLRNRIGCCSRLSIVCVQFAGFQKTPRCPWPKTIFIRFIWINTEWSDRVFQGRDYPDRYLYVVQFSHFGFASHITNTPRASLNPLLCAGSYILFHIPAYLRLSFDIFL